ncbi:hypothetical protein [Hymenobacter glacieicola]|uniref:hypothetical protein n=1 Tax=Hymenobacter glacieicola TaxID=1562124 RepID=UPI00166B92B7|nr:hypothetical protein [Hymenobacter glacieicola]
MNIRIKQLLTAYELAPITKGTLRPPWSPKVYLAKEYGEVEISAATGSWKAVQPFTQIGKKSIRQEMR